MRILQDSPAKARLLPKPLPRYAPYQHEVPFRKCIAMATQQQVYSHFEPLGPTALIGHVARVCHDVLSRWLERRRLYQELTRLDRRELADLRLQPHDIDRLVQGRPVPALSNRSR